MNRLTSSIVALALAGAMSASLADEAHHPEAQTATKPATKVPARAAVKSPARSPAAVGSPRLLENARQSQEEALGIARAKTAPEREALLRQHVQTLREGMAIASAMMAPGAGQPDARVAMPGPAGGAMMGGGMMNGGMMNGGMMGGGMMGSGGPMMGESVGALATLDLSDEQQKRVDAIHDSVRKQNWPLMGRMMDERARLRDLFRAEPRDPAAIGAQYQRIADLRRQMLEAGISAHNQVEEVLTPEQRQALRKTMRRGYGVGGGGMMGQ